MEKEQFIEQGIRYIEEHEMIGSGETVILGLSGGADSLALLLLLLEYQQKKTFSLHAVHVEHGIRGGESLADAGFVRQMCDRLQVSCEIVHVDAPKYAQTMGQSLEEAARNLRYQAFDEAAKKQETENIKIAVAHHMDDQAETVLLSLVRGSGLKGLGGMYPKRDRMIRPLLWASRSQIEEFMQAKEMHYLTDRTNFDTQYMRNRIRHEVMPHLMEVNEQAARHICLAAERLRGAEDFIDQQILTCLKLCTRKIFTGEELAGYEILAAEFEQLHPYIQERVVLEILSKVAGQLRDLTQVHVSAVVGLFGKQSGRSLDLPYQMTAKRTINAVLVVKATKLNDVLQPSEWQYQLSEEQFCFEISDWDGNLQISKKKYTKWFDYDKIEGSVQLRHRKSGDVLLYEDGHTRKLKKYMIDEKIPEPGRERLWVLADGERILWVVGYRISDYYKVTKDTKRVLKVQVNGGTEYERENS